MKFRNSIRSGALTLLGIMGIVGQLGARENITSARPKSQLKTTATGCQPATAAIDLDINNVRARLMTGGDMWWNLGSEVAAYEIPKGSGKSSQFAASCWIGGYDKQGQLKVAAQTYRQDGNDYWPGALNGDGKVAKDTCNLWDKFWKVDRSTIKKFITAYGATGEAPSASDYDVIMQWPAVGNTKAIGSDGVSRLQLNKNNTYAPFKDLNGNGLYEPDQGEYPDITGDQFIWWVFNDAGNVKQQSLTAAMGIEVQTSAFAYATQDFLNNATFANYRVINRGALTIDSTYIAVWDDCDLGYYLDDYIGCDTSRGLGVQYNGNNSDGQIAGYPVNSYGSNPPQVGLDFFQGPKRIKHRTNQTDTIEQLGMTNFTYYNNDASIIGNPSNGVQIYGYMTGSIRDGERFSNDFMGAGIPSHGYGQGPVSNFVFAGDPGNNAEWSECACNNQTGDRRFIFSSGPFQLLPGAMNDITFGCIWASGVGGCGATSFKTIKNIDDGAQALFDNHFKTIEGPEAPRMVVRELDKRLVFYLVNDFGSNNYGENYGNSKGTYNDSLQYHQYLVKSKDISNDSLYRFQGYRVFQLANSQVTSAEIFDQVTGQVDNTKAYEVFQCDVRDGIKQIVNYTKNINISDTTHVAQIKVNGKDSGIVHSFELTQDQFSQTADKSFVNYHNYYFVAIAYAYNNFASFNPRNPDFTQDVPYIGSAHGAGGIDIPVITALPNPSNGEMGTVINSDYGSGVTVTRLEGIGNGGNYVQLSTASMDEAVKNGQVDQAVYSPGQGPINVKIVDPVKVKPYNWVLQIAGSGAAPNGIATTGKWTLTALDGNTAVETIYSERDISAINEQIIEKYGISVDVEQVLPPGSEQVNNNGYIGSSIEFENPAEPWLRGIQDQPDSSFGNWLRSGNNQHFGSVSATNPCNFNDYTKLDTLNFYENMMANFSPAKSTWGPYQLAAGFYGGKSGTGTQCGFEVAAVVQTTTQALPFFKTLQDVDLVFTPDKTKWTRCAVVEEQEDPALAEKGQGKFFIRKHAGWNGDHNGNTPIYSTNPADSGMSWFPGYAVDQNTGKRLNIVFGEDSYLSSDNGNDMLWNPSSSTFNLFDNSIIFGGKHIVYVLNTQYDEDAAFIAIVKQATIASPLPYIRNAYNTAQWVGVPTLNPSLRLAPLTDEGGIIPTKTTLRFRVNRPYEAYKAVDPATISVVPVATATPTNPYYTFSTESLAPSKASDNPDKDKLLTRIYAVPNPYYGYSGYERNRYDTKVRIINLPIKATISIYALDGALIRTLTKNDNTSFIDWDVRNTVGLPISSGMYLMHVKADGVGETIIRWFGAMRPLDVTTY